MTNKRTGTLLFVSTAPGDALRAARRLVERSVIATSAKLGWQLDYIDGQLFVDPYDETALLAAVRKYAAQNHVTGIVTFDERAVVSTATLQEALDIRGNKREAAYASRNKFVMRSRFSSAGLATPQFALVRDLDEAVHVATKQLMFPLVLKPLFGFASQGVIRVNDNSELEGNFEKIYRIAATHNGFVRNDPYLGCLLLEQYLPGLEIAVDAFLADGELWPIGIFDKPDPLEGPTFGETIYVSPSTLSDQASARIMRDVARAATALGLEIGPLHAEVRLTESGPVILEIGARAIGGVCGRAHTYRLGFDYQEIVLRACLGESVTLPDTPQTPAGVMMIPPPSRGRLISVDGLESAREVEGVRDVFIMSKPGDLLRVLPEDGCCVGFIFATGPSAPEVTDRLREAHRRLRFAVAA